MKRVLFDTNILLDIALKRSPFFSDALKLFSLIDQQLITGNITATTLTDLHYIARKERGSIEAIRFIVELLDIVEVIGVDKNTIMYALALDMKDFEDAVQVSASVFNNIDIILTRNDVDFIKSPIPVKKPNEFLKDYI
jgi:predicted nucleic acid-binding protein